MNDWDDCENEGDGVPLALKILAVILSGGYTLFILAVLAKAAVDLWTGGCIV